MICSAGQLPFPSRKICERTSRSRRGRPMPSTFLSTLTSRTRPVHFGSLAWSGSSATRDRFLTLHVQWKELDQCPGASHAAEPFSLPAAGIGSITAPLIPSIAGLAGSAPTMANVQVSVFESGNGTLSQPDDIDAMNGDIFAAWQNGVGPMGEPAPGGGTTSDLVEYNTDGATLNRVGADWQDRWVHGRRPRRRHRGDSERGRELEPLHREPGCPPNQQVTHYAYNLNPLTHGGGTDSVAVTSGQIFVSASAPTVATGPPSTR